MDQIAATLIAAVLLPLCVPWLRRETPRLLRMTRNWLHYGWLVFVILLVAVGAIEGMTGQ